MKSSLPELTKDLDTVFSQYIRLRDTDHNYQGKCITCSGTLHYDHGDCGHWHRRGKNSLRHFELNCFLQCRPCNRPPGNGMFDDYTAAMVAKFGQQWVDEMLLLSNRMAKFPKWFYTESIEYYTRVNEELRKLKSKGINTPKEMYDVSFDNYKQYLI